jgi:hypothetical protein
MDERPFPSQKRKNLSQSYIQRRKKSMKSQHCRHFICGINQTNESTYYLVNPSPLNGNLAHSYVNEER